MRTFSEKTTFTKILLRQNEVGLRATLLNHIPACRSKFRDTKTY